MTALKLNCRFWILVFKTIFLCIAAGGIATHALAAQVTLAWDASPEPDLAGYKIHYGTASGSYSAHLDVRNVTTYTVTGLAEGQTYYFAATAYDEAGNESSYSNQVSYSGSGSSAPVITAGPQAAPSSVTLPASATVSVTASNLRPPPARRWPSPPPAATP